MTVRGPKMPAIAERLAPVVFDWKRWPNTDAFVDDLDQFRPEGNSFVAGLADRSCQDWDEVR